MNKALKSLLVAGAFLAPPAAGAFAGAYAGLYVCDRFYTEMIKQRSYHPKIEFFRDKSFDYADRWDSLRNTYQRNGSILGGALCLYPGFLLSRYAFRKLF